MKITILPSLLAADLGHLADDISRAFRSGADKLHLDIMDAHFVPNLSFGPDVVALSRKTAPGFHRHVHLMMTDPGKYIDAFIQAGAETVQIHAESNGDITAGLRKIRAAGVKAGIVINPETPAEAAFPYLAEADECLVMTVHPGKGGQSFIHECLPKFSLIRREADRVNPALSIMADGGINAETCIEAARMGCDAFVAGSYLFKQQDMAAAVEAMRKTCAEAYGKNA